MGITNSSSEYLSDRDRNTRQELDWLKEKIKDPINIKKQENQNLNKAGDFDINAEVLFDKFIDKNWNSLQQDILSLQNKSGLELTKLLQNNFRNFLKNLYNLPEDQTNSFGQYITFFKKSFEEINKERTALNQETIELTKLELNVLQDEILNSYSSTSGRNFMGNNPTHGPEKIFSGNDLGNTKKKKDDYIENKTNNNQNFERLSYRSEDDQIDPYGNTLTNYRNKINNDLEDIYNDKHVAKVLEKIFDKDDLKRRHFEVNLNAENGLANIILHIQEYAKNKNISIENSTTVYKIFRDILEKENNRLPGSMTELSKKDTIKILELLNISYEKDGIFGDYGRLAEVFNHADRKDLIVFANLVSARSNIARDSKEWLNNKSLLNQPNVLNTENVFNFLSDINSDGTISADKSRKNKEQQFVGDLGNISGQQLLFTIQQAIKTQDALLGDGKGEKVVIKNIARMISLMTKESDQNPEYLSRYGITSTEDIYSKEYKDAIATLMKFPTKENLVMFLSGYTEDTTIAKGFPEAKGFFLAAVEKITGGSSLNQPDLYDVLVGQEGKRLQQIDTTKEVEALRTSIDTYLRNNPQFQKIIQEQGIVEVRETILQQIMEKIDNIGLQISFDAGTDHDMIMSEATKTFYTEQAKKTLLGDINIQQISLGTNLNEIKLSYQIGKSGVSSDKKTKYQIAGGPSFYLGENGISVGLETSFSYGKLTNWQELVSSSLSDVINHPATYIGPEAALGIRAGRNGLGPYASAGIFEDRDHLTGIYLVEQTYFGTSSRIFNIEAAQTFTKQSIESELISNLSSIEKGIYKNFIINNKNKLLEDIRFATEFLVDSGFLKEINASNKSPQEKAKAISSLLKIIQQGNIDQWKGDVIMNLHDKKAITKISAGLSVGTRFFGTKTNSYSGTGTAGESGELPTNQDTGSQTNEGNTTGSSSKESRLSFLGVYVGARISTWKNTYLPNAGQLLLTEQEMNKGMTDQIEAGQDLDKYAKYLEGLFNKEGLTVKKFKNTNNTYEDKLEITYTPQGAETTSLDKLLNIHYLPGKEDQFVLTKDKLIIGNVGPIAAYVNTLPGGVDRVLCLGTKNLNEAKRLTGINKPATDINNIEFKQNGYEYASKEKLDSIINTIKNGKENLPDTEKNLFKSLFDEQGRLVAAPENVRYSRINTGDKISSGNLTLYKKANGKYVLDYQASTDNKLHINYTSLKDGLAQKDVEESIVKDPDLSEKFDSIQLPEAKKVANIEHKTNGELLDSFKNFISYVVKADFNKAVKELNNLLSGNPDMQTKLVNGTPEEKQYIIDNYTSLLAYEEKYEGQTIEQIFTARKDTFLTIKGPGGNFEKYIHNGQNNLKDELLNIRNTFIKENKTVKYEKLDRREPHKNIFGYTAFYRSGVDQGYGATSFGKTNIIENSLTKIENQTDGKQRIIDNLKEDKNHTELLVNQIKKAIKNPDISKYVTKENLSELILKGELSIPNTNGQNNLDISPKKLILSSDAVFYLLGECVNESLGLRINEIKIQETVSVENTEKEYTAEDILNPKYTSNLFGRSNSISGDIQSERYDFSLRGNKQLGEKTKKSTYKGDGKGGEDTDLPGGNDDQIVPE